MPQDNPNGDAGLTGTTPPETLDGSVSYNPDQPGTKHTDTVKTR